MKVLLQRVSSAKVKIKKMEYSNIEKGVLIFLGISPDDDESDIIALTNKILQLRIFSSNSKGMDKSLKDINGSALVVSQFTLYANCENGRRPSFTEAANPEYAKKIYLHFISTLKESGLNIQHGKFGENMEVKLTNSGPVTFMLES